jgi:hypothetical protein
LLHCFSQTAGGNEGLNKVQLGSLMYFTSNCHEKKKYREKVNVRGGKIERKLINQFNQFFGVFPSVGA